MQRFKKIWKEYDSDDSRITYEIVVDTATGINYIVGNQVYGGGITPLLDSDGKPIVTEAN